MREKLGLNSIELELSRITPACAGKTYLEVTFDDEPEDHPRVCGKNAKAMLVSLYGKGSPPRVREKRFVVW